MDPAVPFTRSQALAAGLSDEQLRSTRFRRLHVGVYVLAATPVDPRLRAQAALVRFPGGAFVSHLTAARLYAAPVPPDGTEHVSVLARNDRRRIRGITCHVAHPELIATYRGVRASLPRDLLAELAASLPLVDAVIAGDALVATCGMAVADRGGSQWERRVADVAELVRAGTESPMEARTRLLLALGGLPEPQINPRELDAYTRRRRYDLLFRASRTVVEYDGRQHAEDSPQWHEDLQRREALDEAGWRLLVVTARDFYRRPEETLVKIWRVLRERGEPGLPKRLDDRWRSVLAS